MRTSITALSVAAVAAVLLASGAVAGGAPSASGDGLIAFAGVRWAKNLMSATSQIYVIRADGTGQKRLTAVGTREDTDPAWSPDARRIAFGRREARGWRLLVMDSNGAHLRAITRTAALAEAPSWSRDGRSIAFAQLPLPLPRTGTSSQQVYITAADGSRVRALTTGRTFKGGAGKPAWSPDGRRILFWGGRSPADDARIDVWVVRVNGTGLRMLVPRAIDPAWSPDGKQIAFVRGGDIYTATSAGTGVRRLTRSSTVEDSAPSWSPDGTRIAFSSLHREKNQARDDGRISLIGADGSGLREITDTNPLFWATAPAWRP